MAIDILTGRVLWVFNDTNVRDGATDVFYKNGELYVYSYRAINLVAASLEAINATTGNVTWRIGHHHWMGAAVKNYFYIPETVNHTNTSVSVRIYAINLKTGKEAWNITFNDTDRTHQFQYQAIYVVAGYGNLYIYINDGHVYALNLTTKSIIWKNYVGLNNPPSVFFLPYGPITIGERRVYVPVSGYNSTLGHRCGGIVALNTSNGKKVWQVITDYYWDFQYKFAYSARYHMVVRLNGTGNLIAMDSRDGHILWVDNESSSKYRPSLGGNVIVANNHIYLYRLMWKYPNDIQKKRRVGVLQIFNISDGKLIYEIEVPYQETEAGGTSLDVPDIAVVDGKVIIPDGYLYVFVHNDTSPMPADTTLAYIGISAVMASVIIGSVFIVRRKR